MLPYLKSLIGHRNPLRLAWHKSKALAAAAKYGFPARKLTVIGITGTDGKTTTVGMVAHILHRQGIAVGALSTSSFIIRGRVEGNATQKTSPSPFTIQKFLRRLVDEHCTHAVLEYSSHGLVQGRTLFTWPKVAGITNTALEHLDYHGTMERYRKDKGLLFCVLGGKGTKALNADDESFALYKAIPTTSTIAYSPLHQLTNITSEPTKCSAAAQINGKKWPLTLPIPGAFNLHNALCAIACAEAVGVPTQAAIDALASFKSAPGRMERIDEGQPFSLFIDFTVTPQAFERTLTTVRQMLKPDGRILVLTGSCGDRMREKRPIVGALCSQLADVVVITDDETYTEDPATIIEEVWAGVDQSACEAHKILDRKEAIAFILRQAKPGDAVLLCGLGSYPSRMTPKGPVPWDEQDIARKFLRMMRSLP